MFDTLELIKQLDPDWVDPKGHRMGVAFECSSPGEVDATHSRVVRAGFRSKKDPWDAFWGQRYAQIVDPDDNVWISSRSSRPRRRELAFRIQHRQPSGTGA